MESTTALPSNQVIVCGLGSLGQHCVVSSRGFGLRVTAIESEIPRRWELPELAEMADAVIEGDCRQADTLLRAGVADCRAVLLVTSDEHINIATALAVRALNPSTRLVIRSARGKLNRLLAEHLGNCVSFDATELPAHAFTLAALGTETVGFFRQGEDWLRVVEHQVGEKDEWCLGRRLFRLNSGSRQILRHVPREGPPPTHTFYAWDPDRVVTAGDTLVYLETSHVDLFRDEVLDDYHALGWRGLPARLASGWRGGGGTVVEALRRGLRRQSRRVAVFHGLIALLLVVFGTLLFHYVQPRGFLAGDFYAATLLLLGGFADVFDLGERSPDFPEWFRFVGLLLSISGIALVGVLYAVVTESLLASKFQFVIRRPPAPKGGHVVIVGVKRVGRRVAELLQEFGLRVTCIVVDPEVDATILPGTPLFKGELEDTLPRANIENARSVVVTSEAEILNLEVGLDARARNPDCHLVIRTFERNLSDHLAKLLPNADVLCAYSVAADAFCGAAFGESIQGLFRLNNRTILISHHRVEGDDNFHGRLLSRVAYGFTLIPVFHRAAGGERGQLFPSLDLRLTAGDELVFLSTVDGLRRTECGDLDIKPGLWELTLRVHNRTADCFQGAAIFARIVGRPLAESRELFEQLPQTLKIRLHSYQLHRLTRELDAVQIGVQAERPGTQT